MIDVKITYLSSLIFVLNKKHNKNQIFNNFFAESEPWCRLELILPEITKVSI